VTGTLSFTARRPAAARRVAALVRRDWRIRTSYRAAFVLDFVIGVLDLAVYYYISKTFTGVKTSLDGAPDYFAFALVGIAVTTVITAAATGLALRVREEQLTGTLEALLTQPMSATQLALGMCAFPFLFATVRVGTYLLVGALLLGLDLSHADPLGFFLMLAAIGGAMSSIGILSGAIVLVIKRGDKLAALALFGMGLVGGAFFPVSVLPSWLEAIGRVVPTRFAFDGLRSALYSGSGWSDDALVLAGFTLVCLPISLWLFSRALDWGRRRGSLSQY
jgi:ABC-2 type transport system permease protein